ncbi:MAG: hypothetical protein L0Z71_08475 [Anaerolineae bacterium]|nr:hypothetical protein [Anaerolineae bacterium]
MTLIHIEDLSKHFKILNRREGLNSAFYPSQLFLRPEDVSPLIYFSPIVGMSLFALTYWIWTNGVNSYTGTGA